ncbi:winged helix-turn-helix domain-containing protein [Gaiella sp.]|uniref:winged helix-turn-helix domain-containing protein n=1 Tax=Gaiella sp. TaxID=2663207 RepID=UPI002BA44343|nr:crosslink repair DNA glycosylase YcaQ family protein [Gaiella sp.]HWO81370.1 crosslink repair DNA glycosylase YcaQ family protein [Gaiella sp.]
MRRASISAAAVRRIAVAAQGYAARGRRATTAEVETAVRRLSCVQLDSISTVDRSHRIALGGRIGDFPRDAVSRLLARGRLIEYWAHEACLLPAEHWPLLRPAMQVGGRRWYGEVDRTHPHLREHILDEIRARGPLGSRHFDGAARKGEMWGWKPAKQMLELLWNHGELVVAGRQGFQRLYDLPERVLPPETLDAPTPKEPERLRELVTRAVRGRGVLTERGIVEHWRLRGGAPRVRPVVDALVDEGALERHAVEDGGPPVLVAAGTELDPPAPRAAVLLSPFDNLLWDRPFARRVLGFDHLIEVYKPAPQRRYGYYVLPLLRGDRVVGRADLKSERAEGRLVVKAFHREPGVRASGGLDDALDRALDRLRRVIGLETVLRA